MLCPFAHDGSVNYQMLIHEFQHRSVFSDAHAAMLAFFYWQLSAVYTAHLYACIAFTRRLFFVRG